MNKGQGAFDKAGQSQRLRPSEKKSTRPYPDSVGTDGFSKRQSVTIVSGFDIRNSDLIILKMLLLEKVKSNLEFPGPLLFSIYLRRIF
jgi:hypothetical protein